MDFGLGDVILKSFLGLMLFVFISTFIAGLIFSIIDYLKQWRTDYLTGAFFISFFVSLIYFLIISFQVDFDYQSRDFFKIKQLFSELSVFYFIFIGLSSLFCRWITAWIVFIIGEICQKK